MMNPKYAAILHLPHQRSQRRPPMSVADRAAQFAPFSALDGHREGTAETARVTQCRRILCEDEMAMLDEKLREIAEKIGEYPTISVTHFVPDAHKEGGGYVTTQGQLKRIDCVHRLLIFMDRREIFIDDIVEIEG